MDDSFNVDYIRENEGNVGVVTTSYPHASNLLDLATALEKSKKGVVPVEGDLIKVTKVSYMGNVTGYAVVRQEKYVKGKWELYDEREMPSKFIRALNNLRKKG